MWLVAVGLVAERAGGPVTEVHGAERPGVLRADRRSGLTEDEESLSGSPGLCAQC